GLPPGSGRRPAPGKGALNGVLALAALRLPGRSALACHAVGDARGEERTGVRRGGHARVVLVRPVDGAADVATAELDAHLAAHTRLVEARVDDQSTQDGQGGKRNP